MISTKQCNKCFKKISLNQFDRHFNSCCINFCPCGKPIKKWMKYCSLQCSGKFVTFETKQKRLDTIRKKVKLRGYFHSKETKEKIRIAHKGLKSSINTCKKISITLKGRKLSKTHKINISKGITNSDKFYDVNWPKIRKMQWSNNKNIGMKGKHHSAEHKKNMRIYMLNYIEKNKGKPFAFIGKNETQILNEQEIKDNCKIQRQYHIKDLGYIVDGYCPETNTVYEVYEKRHKLQDEHDKQRQQEIENYLNCKFIVFWDLKVSGKKRSF
jgi:hypothetical protein